MLSLLEREHEDVEQLANVALTLAWSHLMHREWWCVVFHQPRVWTTVHGPFESRNVAEKYAIKYLVASVPDATASFLKMADSNLSLELDLD